ncbi:histidine kinase [Fredinandcohnia humi]
MSTSRETNQLSLPHGNRATLWSFRVVWLVMAIFTIYLLLLDLPVRLEAYQTVCKSIENGCLETNQLNEKEVNELVQMGLSLKAYTGFKLFLDSIVAFVFFSVSALLLFRKERLLFNLYVSLVFLSLGAGISHYFPENFPEWNVVYHIISAFGGSYLVLFLVLPDGRFVPRWTIGAAIFWAIVGIGSIYFSGSFLDVETWPIWLGIVSWVGLHLVLVLSQLYRYVKKSNQIQKQQMKWVLYSIAMYFIALLCLNFIGQLGVTLKIVTELFYVASFILIPIAIAFAVFRYKLWEINVVIHRTVLYGSLSVFVVLFYVGAVWLISKALRSEDNFLASIITAGIIAVVFHPLKERLQTMVNRMIYGERDNPYSILNQLNTVLEAAKNTENVLPRVVKTLSQALKIPYVAILLREREITQVIASVGNPEEVGIDIPLFHQGQELGTLRLSHRSSTEPFSKADKILLQDLARQVGIVAHSILLHKDLQWSRQQLVNAREEERRRLRRDLHDGLGPSLASLAIKMDVANSIMSKDPHKSQELLQEMDLQIKQLLKEIRRIVYSLRPSSLDELGLLSAIREITSQYKTSKIHFSVSGPEILSNLPAAVEVAVYRIVQEAVTNIIRHSDAQNCTISISINDKLHLVVTDDGKGLPEHLQYGIGIKSMKERAEELGGIVKIYSEASKGTSIQAELPI